jgi:hypothetical protein
MPNFLHYIRLDVENNWFKLNNPDDFRVTTGRRVEQGRVVKMLHECAQACNTEQYREADVRVLFSKLKQLENMLPLQTHVVPVPFENTLGGFDLFGQGNTAIAPQLIGYEGLDVFAPPAASTGAGTTAAGNNTNTATVTNSIAVSTGTPVATTPAATPAAITGTDVILYGKYFSILESQVVVGGKAVTANILSREVAWITIPKEAQATTIKDKGADVPYLEVHIATPNGISNRLLIPYQAAAKPASTALFTLTGGVFSANVKWEGDQLVVKDKVVDGKVTIAWNGPNAGTVTPPKAVFVVVETTTSKGSKRSSTVLSGAAITLTNGKGDVKNDDIAKQVVIALADKTQFSPGAVLPVTVTVNLYVIVADSSPVASTDQKVDGTITGIIHQVPN